MEYFPTEDYENLSKKYRGKIANLSNWLWQKKIKATDIESWLNNFTNEDCEREKINGLHLLSQFMFFELREVREMLKSLYRDHFFKPTVQHLKTQNTDDIQSEYKKILNKTRFISIGNSSESSSLMLYFFRQVNQLSKEMFMDRCDIFELDDEGSISGLKTDDQGNVIEIDNYIFIDDLAGTGSQACKELRNRQIKKIQAYNPNAKIYYFTLFSTPQVKKTFEFAQLPVILKTVFELDETYKVFHNESRYFQPKSKYDTSYINERTFSHTSCLKYFERFHDNHCGFGDSQLMLGFFYNTPDNTLASFWFEHENWSPVFKRFDKIYG